MHCLLLRMTRMCHSMKKLEVKSIVSFCLPNLFQKNMVRSGIAMVEVWFRLLTDMPWSGLKGLITSILKLTVYLMALQTTVYCSQTHLYSSPYIAGSWSFLSLLFLTSVLWRLMHPISYFAYSAASHLSLLPPYLIFLIPLSLVKFYLLTNNLTVISNELKVNGTSLFNDAFIPM